MSDWQNRTMTPHQYAWAIKTLGLNKAQAGRFLGVSERTAHRYHDGDTAIPAAHSLLLRAMINYGEPPEVPPYKGIRARRAEAKAEQAEVV